jgi:hypothetical protein
VSRLLKMNNRAVLRGAKEAWRGRSEGGEAGAQTAKNEATALSRRVNQITARATGLHLRCIFPQAEKPPITTLRLCNLPSPP